jgi:dTDP-4-amino-4,6-dideoxygalactose transaminase
VGKLPVTESLAGEVLNPPLWVGLSQGDIERVAGVIKSCQRSKVTAGV